MQHKCEMIDETALDSFKFENFDMGRCALISGPRKCSFGQFFSIRSYFFYSFSICSVLCKIFGFKNSGLTLAIWPLVGIGRSGAMIGRLCLNMVS